MTYHKIKVQVYFISTVLIIENGINGYAAARLN